MTAVPHTESVNTTGYEALVGAGEQITSPTSSRIGKELSGADLSSERAKLSADVISQRTYSYDRNDRYQRYKERILYERCAFFGLLYRFNLLYLHSIHPNLHKQNLAKFGI